MRVRTIVLFIFGVLAGLALVCELFPSGGINFLGAELEFPTLHDVLSGGAKGSGASGKTESEETDDDANLTPEQLYKKQLASLNINDKQQFLDFAANSPLRIDMPDGDVTYLDSFFESLENADKEVVRIIHYGDSQLEGGRIDSDFREELQAAFGGSGAGMAPAVQTINTYTLLQSTSPELHRHQAFNPELHTKDGRYGVMAQVGHCASRATFNFRGTNDDIYPHAQPFQRVTVVCSGNPKASVTADGNTVELTDDGRGTNDVKFLTGVLPQPVSKGSVTVNGKADIYTVMLDGKTGVQVDNIPMRGCSGTIFTTIQKATIEPFFAHERVGLIILQYGGNSVPYLKKEHKREGYKGEIKRQIEYFRSIAPNAKILFIGPADMATRVQGQMQTYPHLRASIDMLREAALESGAAFWDMQAVMGGDGSMVKWVKQNPPLAGNDYIHFTQKGAHEMAHRLFETFQTYYRFYCLRNGKKPKTDSTAKQSVKERVDSARAKNRKNV